MELDKDSLLVMLDNVEVRGPLFLSVEFLIVKEFEDFDRDDDDPLLKLILNV